MDGHSFADIDTSRPLTVSALTTSEMESGPLREAAERLGDPRFLSVMETAESITLDPASGAALLRFLSHPTFEGEFERDLQCLAETKDGEPLLTTFFDLIYLSQLFFLLDDDGPFADLRKNIDAWLTAGFERGELEGFAVRGFED